MPVQHKNTETEQIADQLRRLYAGPSWLGPSLQDLVGDVTEETARRRAVPGAHTIWELVLHMTTWLRIARERLSATNDLDPRASENWPPMLGSWQEASKALSLEISALVDAILSFPGNRLEERAPAQEEQTFYQLLHGVIQHTAYHAGQVALLKK
jgi:uncharacterized damage-inducible protein DinB